MKTMLLRGIIVAAAACLPTAAFADHMSPYGEGWANMPNDIHNTRLETRIFENETFLLFVMFGEGADSTNRFLVEETAAVEDAIASGQRVTQLAARLLPQDDFLGAGWARYTEPDNDTLVSRVLNINVRLRLVTQNGAVANAALDLTSGEKTVVAHFGYLTPDASVDYAACTLETGIPIDTDGDGVADYAVYSLSLKEDTTGVIEGTGACQPMLPEVQLGDIVDIAVDEVSSVLTGSFTGSF